MQRTVDVTEVEWELDSSGPRQLLILDPDPEQVSIYSWPSVTTPAGVVTGNHRILGMVPGDIPAHLVRERLTAGIDLDLDTEQMLTELAEGLPRLWSPSALLQGPSAMDEAISLARKVGARGAAEHYCAALPHDVLVDEDELAEYIAEHLAA